MKEIITKIKRKETPFYKFIYVFIQSILRLSLPVNKLNKPIFSLMYSIHVFIRESLIWLVKTFYYEPLFRSQCFYVGKKLWMEKLPYIVGSGKIIIGENVRLSGKPSFAFNNKINSTPELIIKDNTFIGHNVSFAIAEKVEIGKNCLIARGVSIMDNDGHPLDYLKRRKGLPPDKNNIKPVIIGDDVWIGKGAVITKGVKIGDRVVVGAMAVVTKDVPSDCVVAGNPAKVIKWLNK